MALTVKNEAVHRAVKQIAAIIRRPPQRLQIATWTSTAGMIGRMPANRMNREQFFDTMAGLDQDRLRVALWNLSWRGTAPMRQRIEVELAGGGRAPRPVKAPADPQAVYDEVEDFVALARSGAYLGRDRRVSPRERTRWRFTFKRLADDAHDALRAEDPAPERARALAQWHSLLLDNLDTDSELLDRIAAHAALGGPERMFVTARLAQRRGDTDTARKLTVECLRTLPGHTEFRALAAEIGAATE